MSHSNQENNSDGGNGFNLGPDILEALLRASQSTADAENLDNLGDISGEYSSINKTIDELNGFLDRWEERHTRLRNEIREVLTEQEQSTEESTMGSSDHLTGEQHTNVSAESSEAQNPNVSEEASSNEDSLSQICEKNNSDPDSTGSEFGKKNNDNQVVVSEADDKSGKELS